MKANVRNINSTSCLISIEVSSQELTQQLDRVYQDIGRFARVPGFRPGKAPRDLLETHYKEKAQEEVTKRAIPEYYLKAVQQEGVAVVSSPEIENVQLKDQALYFSARVDVRPQIRLKNYKNLKLIRKKVKIEDAQVEQVIEKLRKSKETKGALPELNDALARDLGLNTLAELREAINKNLLANAEIEKKQDLERQLIEQLLTRAALDAPESMVKNQMQELLNQLKLNRILQGEKKEDVEARQSQLQEEARREAVRRVRLSFILDEIGQREKIQVNDEDFKKRIEAIAQRSGKGIDEVREYLKKQNLIPGLSAEIRDRKTLEFLLSEAKVEEAK
jgi:FKBP-type peptidyl-prolyl cis-trans isomerase (trigger factor)